MGPLIYLHDRWKDKGKLEENLKHVCCWREEVTQLAKMI
jgi:hypothetical protein